MSIAQAKIDLVKSTVITAFENTNDIDEIALQLVPFVMDKQISVSEIATLIQYIGKSEGYIVPLTKRKENAEAHIEDITVFQTTYPEFMTEAEDIAHEFSVNKTWTVNKMKAHYAAMKKNVPQKSTLLGWQRVMVDCFLDNPECTREQIIECIQNTGKKEVNMPASMLSMLQYMYAEMTK